MASQNSQFSQQDDDSDVEIIECLTDTQPINYSQEGEADLEAEPEPEEKKGPPAKKAKAEKSKRIAKRKHWLLTYPHLTEEQCDLDAIMANVKKLGFVSYACVSREEHKDGTPHVHIFVSFTKARQFTFSAKGELSFLIPGGKHGNFKGHDYGSTDDMLAYVQKDKDFIEDGVYISDSACAWTQAIKAKSKAESMNILKTAAPRDYVLWHDKIDKTMSNLHAPPAAAYQPPAHHHPFDNVPQVLQDWVTNELPKTDRARCLVLIGGTRTGKSSWARSLRGRHVFMRTHFSVDALRVEPGQPPFELLIFDDNPEISEKKFKYRKGLLTQMGAAFLADKYRAKRNVDVTQPAIVLVNKAEYVPWCTDPSHDEYDYWQRNSTVVDIGNEKLCSMIED